MERDRGRVSGWVREWVRERPSGSHGMVEGKEEEEVDGRKVTKCLSFVTCYQIEFEGLIL